MGSTPTSRFDAQAVGRLATSNDSRRFEMEFRDAAGRTHVVSLPLEAAVELGCLICDVAQKTPFLPGGTPKAKPDQAPGRKRSK